MSFEILLLKIFSSHHNRKLQSSSTTTVRLTIATPDRQQTTDHPRVLFAMPPAKRTGTYYPTHKLTEEDRNIRVGRNRAYGHKKIENIFRQDDRPQLPRRTVDHDELTKLWIEQDRQIVKAGGWMAKDYVSVPGRDGFPGLGAMVHKTEDDKDSDDGPQHGGDEKEQHTDESNQGDDEDAQGDKDSVVGDEQDQEVAQDDEDNDLVEKLIRSYDTSNIKMPTKDAMKADLKAWGKWKRDGRRNRGDIFREMWLPEFLRRKAEAEAAEIRARKVLRSTDTMMTKRDRIGERVVRRENKRKRATPAATTPVAQKPRLADTDETRPRKRPKFAGANGAHNATAENLQPQLEGSQQDIYVPIGSVDEDVSVAMQRVEIVVKSKPANKQRQAATANKGKVKSTSRPQRLITKLRFSKHNMDRVRQITGECDDPHLNEKKDDQPRIDAGSDDGNSCETISDREQHHGGFRRSTRRQGSEENQGSRAELENGEDGIVAKDKSGVFATLKDDKVAEDEPKEEMVWKWYPTHYTDDWGTPPDPRFDHLIPNNQLISFEQKQRYELQQEAAHKKAEEDGVPFQEPPPPKKKWRLQDHPRKPGEVRRAPRFGKDGELIRKK
jgi:hypothetical protein